MRRLHKVLGHNGQYGVAEMLMFSGRGRIMFWLA
jgi:hypothetical protein